MNLLGYMTVRDDLRLPFVALVVVLSNAVIILLTQIKPKESLISAKHMYIIMNITTHIIL